MALTAQESIRVDVVSAEASLFAGEARLVIAPASEGELGITPGHAPLLTRLKPGELRIVTVEGDALLLYVSGGLLEIQPFVVTVLADTAQRAEDLDEAAARRAVERAQREIDSGGGDRLDPARAQQLLAEAEAQLRTLEDLRRLRRGARNQRGG